MTARKKTSRLVPLSRAPAGVVLNPVLEGSRRSAPEGSLGYRDLRDDVERSLKADGFTGKRGQICISHHRLERRTVSVITVGLGDADGLHPERLREVMGDAARRLPDGLRGQNAVRLVLNLDESPWKEAASGEVPVADRFAAGRDPERAAYTLSGLLQAAVEGWGLGAYAFLDHQTRRKVRSTPGLEVQLRGRASRLRPSWGEAVRRGDVVVEAVRLARDLANTPANALNPAGLARHAQALAKRCGLSCEVLDEKALRREKMNALLSVGQGSDAVSKFIVLKHSGTRGRTRQRPLVLVGKAITFDSGGLSIKTARGMENMKTDMAGGAAVLAALGAIARLGLRIPVVGLIPSAENMISGCASRPGDVVKTRSGLTIEIVNTDAEGRLVLADALDYARKFKPALVVDLATLTGACVVALGDGVCGVLANDRDAISKVCRASAVSGEKVWELPLYKEFFDQIRSDTADMKNSGGRNGGAITAAALLAQFIEGVPWCHVDIAGPAWSDKEEAYRGRGATGAGVRLLVELARSMSGGRSR